MSVRRLKVRDPRHLLDSPPRVPSSAPPTETCSPSSSAAHSSLATTVMANSVEGPAPQPSRQPTAQETEAAAAKEERRASEPVPKKRRLLQATETEQAAGGQNDPEDILAQVINAVGIDSNLAESEVEELPPMHHPEGVVGLQYLKEVRSLPPGMTLSPRMRAPDLRVRSAYPPPYHVPLEGHYAVRELRHPYPYPLRPHELIAHQGPPPPYRSFLPRHYLRPHLPPSQAISRLPIVRPQEHLAPQHGSSGVPRHYRPSPLHTSPPDTPSEVHRVLAAPSHPGLPGPNTEIPSRFYPGGPLGRPELKGPLPPHLREVYVPVHALPGGSYPHMRPRVPEGLTRFTYDLRGDPGRELGPRKVMVSSHFTPANTLPPRPVYSSERHRGTDPAWRPPVVGEGALRPPRRIIEPPSPCVELIPIGPCRTSAASPSTAARRHESDPNGPPAGTPLTGPKSQTEGPDGRRQSEPVLTVKPLRPPLTQRSFSSDIPRRPPAPAALSVDARRSSDPVVAKLSTSAQVDECGHVSEKEDSMTGKAFEENTRPSSTNSDVTIEKVVLVNPGGGEMLPHTEQSVHYGNAGEVAPRTGQPAACNGRHEVEPQEGQPPFWNVGDVDPSTGQSVICSEASKVTPHTVQRTEVSDAPVLNLNTCRPASEPPLGSVPPQVTSKRPASLPAPGVAPQTCSGSDDNVSSEDVVFMERLQLVLSDLLSVPEATQLQELSCSPARLLSTLVRRCGVQPSTNPNLQKRLREDFKTMVQLCMPPTLIQDFGWKSCTSEQILTQLLRLSHNGEDVNRRSSLSSYVPPDETLEDDVFSPSTPHTPVQTPHQPQTDPQPSKPSHPPPQPPRPSHPPPPVSHPSHPPPSTSHPSHLQASTSHPPPSTSHPPPSISHPPHSSSHSSHPPPSTFHPPPSTSHPPPSPSHPPPSPSKPSHAPPSTSHLSHPPPSTSHPSHPPPPPSQPSHPPPLAPHSSLPHPQTSQPSQSHPETFEPSQCPSSSSHPHPQPPKPTQPTHPSPQSPQTSQHPPPASQASSHTSKPSPPSPQVVQPSLPSPQRLQPSHPTPPSTQAPLQASNPSQSCPENVHPSHAPPPSSTPPTSQHSHFRQPAPRPSLLPLTPSEPSYLPSSPSQQTHLPPSPSQLYHHLTMSPHLSHPPPLKPQPLHPSHLPPRLPPPTSQPSHVITPTSRPSHVSPLTSPSSHFTFPPSQSHHLPQSSSHPPHLQSPVSRPPHLPPSPSRPTHSSPQISPISYLLSPSPPTSRAPHLPPSPSPPTSRPAHLPPHASPPTHRSPPSSRPSNLPLSSQLTISSPPHHPPSPSSHPTIHIPVSSPSCIQPPASRHAPFPIHVSQAQHLPPHVSQATHLPPHVSQATHLPPHVTHSTPLRLHYPKQADELNYTHLQYYLQASPRPRIPSLHHYPNILPHHQPLPPPPHHADTRKDVPAPPPPGKDTVIHLNHQHHQPHPPPHLHHHSPPPPVRYTAEKWIGNDEVVRPTVYASTNGRVSPTSKTLPT